jgi:hypothetical protein
MVAMGKHPSFEFPSFISLAAELTGTRVEMKPQTCTYSAEQDHIHGEMVYNLDTAL